VEVTGADVDVAVIGAGPAGSVTAALLASRGYSVALVDRDRFPRDKVCGEFLSYDAMPVLEAMGLARVLDEQEAPHIARCRIVGSRESYEFEFHPSARGMSRLAFDDLLFRHAIALGAEDFSGWTATRLTTAAAPALTLSRVGEERAFGATVVVGAWGRWGRFDAQLGREFVRNRRHRHFGFKRHYRVLAHQSAELTIDLYSFRSGYLGVSCIEGGLTNICGLVHADRLGGLRGGWEGFTEQIRAEGPHLDRLFASHEPAQEEFLSSDPVIFRGRSAVVSGVFMTGDASGVIDPLAGDGMAMAVQSALLAACAIHEIFRGSDRGTIERRYQAEHERFFVPRISWSRRAAAILSRPALVDALLRSFHAPAIGRFLMAKTRVSCEQAARLADRWFAGAAHS
jgi:menaquinone-9 beta-reductase